MHVMRLARYVGHSRCARRLRPHHSSFCTNKKPTEPEEHVLYEDYKTPSGGTYRLPFNAHERFTGAEWEGFEKTFGLDKTPSDEEIDAWVEKTAIDSHVVTLSSEPRNTWNNDVETKIGEPSEVQEFDEFERPVRSVRELRKLGKQKNEIRSIKKQKRAKRAVRLAKEMEMAALRALDGDGGGGEDGVEICDARLSDNLRDLTIVYRSNISEIEKQYDEMGKRIKSEIANSMRTRFIPNVWFKKAEEEDQRLEQLQRMFEQIARERDCKLNTGFGE